MKKKLKPIKKNFNLLIVSVSTVVILTSVIIFSFRKPLAKISAIPPIQQYQHPLVPELTIKNMPNVSATNYVLVDVATNKVLFSKGADQRIYPASITKLATALTALNIYPLDESVTVGVGYTEGQNMNLAPGETLTVKSLVSALLVYSANDAAYNLAAHHRDGPAGFVKEMNLIAAKYNLKNTRFTNFDGIHNPDHYSTVYDLSQLGRLAIKNSIIRDTVKNKEITVTDVTGKIVHRLESTDELVGTIPEIEGLKTGWTPEAGGCFIALMNLNGHYLISVVAQSADRFADTKIILDWAKINVLWLPYQP
jgi:D-alanyl-D-alanine carboxypeptidase